MYKDDISERNLYDGETGKPVAEDFSYSSNNNDQWLTQEDLIEIIK